MTEPVSTASALPLLPPGEVRVAPSLLAADFGHLAEEIERVSPATDWLHVDVMDGHFVPNISLGVPVVASIHAATPLFLDCHLMISEPERYLEPFAKAGADACSVHVELGNTPALCAQMRSLGLGAGLVVNPETAVEEVFPFLELIDYLLVMSVHPGYGGQAFIWEAVAKLEAARAEIDRQGLAVTLQVDGGIDEVTVGPAARAGARCFVAGSSVFRSPDPLAAALRLRDAALAELGVASGR